MADRMEQLAAAIELSLIPGLGNIAQARLRAQYPRLSGLFDQSSPPDAPLVADAQAREAIVTRRYRAAAEEILDWARKEDCLFLVHGDELYPALLEEIPDPPGLLYARGDPEVLREACVSIVGTRRPTIYGLQMAKGLAADLAERGLAIVSGLARGIDGAAHRGCLDAKGKTIAVLGNGIDVVYPREHGSLTRMIRDSGLLLSEFPPGTSPAPQNFPVRNRLISGLSLGTMIVEASEYSGSLITARLAMEQNREVFAIPGNLTTPQSFGPNFLLKQGAKLVQSWRDVVEELPADLRQSILSREDCRQEGAPRLEMFSPEEATLLQTLQTDMALSFDKIYVQSGIEMSQLSNLLLGLEMRGWIRQVPGNLFVKVARLADRGTWNSRKP